MLDIADPNQSEDKLIVKLISCIRCGNAFMIKKGDVIDLKNPVCENCIKLEERKRELEIDVLDQVILVENRMEESINEMKNQLTVSKATFNKEFFLQKIKRRAQCLNKSIELLEKIEDTNDEEFIEEYQNLFDKMKQDSD